MSEYTWQRGEKNRDKQIGERKRGSQRQRETERDFNDPSQEKEGIKKKQPTS